MKGNATTDDLVTVVIPARNEEGFIGRCLDSILTQDHAALQIVVVDGASTDRTVEIVRGYAERDPRVECLSNPDAIIPKSMNLALAAARGRWLVRVDGHAAIPPHYVRRAVDDLRSGSWGGVGGRKDGIGVTRAGKAIAAAMASPFGVGNSTYHFGTSPQPVDHVPFGAYPVALARKLGGWDERLRVNQDFEFDYRVRAAGHQILFDPELVIGWECRQHVGDLFKQYRRYGRGKTWVALLHPDSLQPRHLVAPVLVGGWAEGLALGLRWHWILAVAFLPYLLGLSVATALTARKVSWRSWAFIPGAFVAMHVGWGLGFWEGATHIFRGRFNGELRRFFAANPVPSSVS
jgi:glycosyltransferase involved in cell wall biosynthesis